MAAVDLRQPAEVTADFRRDLAELLTPRGFVARAKGARLVRKQGKNRHEIELGSSHYNAPGSATCFVSLSFFDGACGKEWRAGGSLEGPGFFEQAPNNIAVADEAAGLLRLI